MNIFRNLPDEEALKNWYGKQQYRDYCLVNAHIHTPYSFSSFETIESVFRQAVSEGIKVLGINDFYVADGYSEFGHYASLHHVFPLFNIEFIGLMKEMQKKDIRINDPNNPGRIYFSGKGLDNPFHTGLINGIRLRKAIKESQVQIKRMIQKVNHVLEEIDTGLVLEYSAVKKRFARQLVRERHIAKAIRILVEEKYQANSERDAFYRKLFRVNEFTTDPFKPDILENEIRSRLLKAGGRAFVPEDEKAFLSVEQIISIIIQAGGVPCYPVLLDDARGNFTEFEAGKEFLMQELLKMNIRCVELIPGRNDLRILLDFVRYFHGHGFVVLLGTEHNAPGNMPLEVSARNNEPLPEELLRINYEGACLIAAHQYLRSHKKQGILYPCGAMAVEKKEQYAELGKIVIEYFITQR